MERQEQGKEPGGIVVHDMHIILVAEQSDHRREKTCRPAGGVDHAIHGKTGGHQDECHDIPDQVCRPGQRIAQIRRMVVFQEQVMLKHLTETCPVELRPEFRQ